MNDSDSKPQHDLRQDIVWHQETISREMRRQRLGQRGCVIWFTGLSGCGKSTIANELERLLFERDVLTTLLDGDNIRHGLCAPPAALSALHGDVFAERFGLGFSAIDREENIRRIGAVGQLFVAAGVMALTAFVSPYREDRDRVRTQVDSAGQTGDFIEVFVDTPLEICEKRDPKGLYKKARAGEIKNFTGISDPYESPGNPDVHIRGGDDRTPQQQAEDVLDYLQSNGYFGTS
ncbi:MAG: adenylyl-sulfate kinase [Planctomycetota bacterium]